MVARAIINSLERTPHRKSFAQATLILHSTHFSAPKAECSSLERYWIRWSEPKTECPSLNPSLLFAQANLLWRIQFAHRSSEVQDRSSEPQTECSSLKLSLLFARVNNWSSKFQRQKHGCSSEPSDRSSEPGRKNRNLPRTSLLICLKLPCWFLMQLEHLRHESKVINSSHLSLILHLSFKIKP